MQLKNLLLSVAIGDISGMPYEFGERNKDYHAINLLHPYNTYTDDTVCTFACAEALLHNKSVAACLWQRGRQDPNRGYGGRYAYWLHAASIQPSYHSFGNGSAMRCAAAGFMACSEEQCVELATLTALPTHDHPEGIKGAVATALTIYYAMHNKDKAFIRHNVLAYYYPEWAYKAYTDIQSTYSFDETCQQTVPAALICFLESRNFADCIKLAIALGGDGDTLAAIAAPMAYAHFKQMPKELIDNAKHKLPNWMLALNDEFDNSVAGKRIYRGIVRPLFTPEKLERLKSDEVFVFGSNLEGIHGGGAARVARMLFGAQMGQGVGMQGQSYAIPTMQGGVETIRPYVDQFIAYARQHIENFFFVTRIGCGIAGFSDKEIAPLFAHAVALKNVCLPKSFVAYLESKE